MAYQFVKARQAILHAEKAVELFINDYRVISEDERILGTHAVLNAVRLAKRYADEVERYFKSNLIDEFKLDYHKLKFTFRTLADQWDDCYYSSGDFSTKSDTIMEGVQLSTLKAMNTLLATLDSANKDIADLLNRLYTKFDNVDKLIKKYSEDAVERKNTLDNGYMAYLGTGNFQDKKRKFEDDIISYLIVHGKTYDSYRTFCHEEEKNANDLCVIELEGRDVGKYMVEHRTEVTGLALEQYYFFRYEYSELTNRMARFEYEGVCDSHYAGMFKTKAAEKLAVVFGQIFHNHIDKLKGNKYAMVMLAMKDMKLIEEGQYGLLFKDFVNSEILEQNRENPIADAKTITDVTKKVKNHPFKRLSADDLKDSGFDKNEFDRLSGFYWQCISIMNMVLEYNLKAKGFADYLCNTHPNTPDYDIFDNIAELKVLSSVLKGETPTI